MNRKDRFSADQEFRELPEGSALSPKIVVSKPAIEKKGRLT